MGGQNSSTSVLGLSKLGRILPLPTGTARGKVCVDVGSPDAWAPSAATLMMSSRSRGGGGSSDGGAAGGRKGGGKGKESLPTMTDLTNDVAESEVR
eukprot:2047324-Rhodomonas_salina.1